MNEKVNKRLERIKEMVVAIQSSSKCIFMDVDDVESVEDMFVIEHNFDMIRRIANDAVDYVRETEDEFDGE